MERRSERLMKKVQATPPVIPAKKSRTYSPSMEDAERICQKVYAH